MSHQEETSQFTEILSTYRSPTHPRIPAGITNKEIDCAGKSLVSLHSNPEGVEECSAFGLGWGPVWRADGFRVDVRSFGIVDVHP